jgi:hypothetical protein
MRVSMMIEEVNAYALACTFRPAVRLAAMQSGLVLSRFWTVTFSTPSVFKTFDVHLITRVQGCIDQLTFLLSRVKGWDFCFWHSEITSTHLCLAMKNRAVYMRRKCCYL